MEHAKSKSQCGKQYTTAERLMIIEQAEQINVKAASEKSGASPAVIYRWQKLYKDKDIAGLEDGRQHNSGAKPIADWKRTKVLQIKETDADFGPSQIRNQLRRQGTTISIESICKVLKDTGYELARRHAPKKEYIRFEASRPLVITTGSEKQQFHRNKTIPLVSCHACNVV